MASVRRMILAGDIGGTNARLAFFSVEKGRPALAALEVFPSREHRDLGEIAGKFIKLHPRKIASACFGVAGPVRNNRVETPNLPWVVDADRLAQGLGLEKVELINDLEANACGIQALTPNDFAFLNAGSSQAKGNAALISAGTGLGEAGLRWEKTRHLPLASEGGHADFAPRNELEIELLRFLLREHDRVSCERVLSGPGLHNIYRFLRDTGRGVEETWLAEALAAGDPPAVISQAALDGRSPLCASALDVFVGVYGAEAGNFALKMLATGGIYLGGGIAPKILRKLREPAFMTALAQKGRMRPLLEAVPVRVILNDKTALLGAAQRAL